ncbi:hypothetical protein FEM48_Zijuj08G0082400 [Ziziphus jujuba var. spinosa]|uniref:DUF1990 domain-containing protein n=1 Tax=Ziziphus jujuba var. spinosa TaxID=714518 RepID=A0A978UXZ8_ZIZJJ|nr:hypothetical protein FEM48_Zijuj08G0082400 [Ziziphus jujuba var. spinosa]
MTQYPSITICFTVGPKFFNLVCPSYSRMKEVTFVYLHVFFFSFEPKTQLELHRYESKKLNFIFFVQHNKAISVVARVTEMVFLCWARPSPQEQKSCIDRSGAFNYDAKYRGATAKPLSCLKEDKELSHEGFALNHARVLVGSGIEAYEKGKNALQAWRHFGLNWAFVDPKTPVQNGAKFCVCVKEFLPWVMMPLKAGEERFSIELDENDQVWYEILSFSKPAHVLSFIGYPYVMLRQKYFSHQSTNAVLKHLNPLQS